MKEKIWALLLAFCIGGTAFGESLLPAPDEIHPEIYKVLKSYPPLLRGGYRIEKYDNDRYIVIGVGRAGFKKNFFMTFRAAELDAEVQIAKAINATTVTAETKRTDTAVSTSDGNNLRVQDKRKFAKMLVSSRTPFIISCGTWSRGNSIYCARAVFVGDFEHTALEGNLNDRVQQLSSADDAPPELLNVLRKLPYLAKGGTAMIVHNGSNHIITVVCASEKMSYSNRLTFARNHAYKNIIAFISGGKLEHQLTVLSETQISSDGTTSARRRKRKELEASIQGEAKFITPLMNWKIPETGYQFFLYAIKL
jgi:hypothetical protein